MTALRTILVLCCLSPLARSNEPSWHDDYAQAYHLAQSEGKLLLVSFHAEGRPLDVPVAENLRESLVFCRVPTTATIATDKGTVVLLESAAFAALEQKPGLAVVNLARKGPGYGRVAATLSQGDKPLEAARVQKFLGAVQAEPGVRMHTDEFGLPWHLNYDEAYRAAKQQKKLLLVAFDSSEARLALDRATAGRMRNLVLVRLQVEKSGHLLSDPGFRQFHAAAGAGILNLKDDGPEYGRLTHVLPAIYASAQGTRAMVELAERTGREPQLRWHTDYHAAREEAARQKKMLLVAVDSDEQRFEPRAQSLPALFGYVLLRQSVDSAYDCDGQPRKLVEFGDFQALRRQPGLVIYDFKHEGEPFYGQVVSAMPYRYLGPETGHRVFGSEERERELLALEPETLTRRTLTWAIRVSKGHGENQRLRSADGRPSGHLMLGAMRNSLLQCRFGCGHHAGGLSGAEIASPGLGRDIVDGALNMVRIWAGSPPHYGVMVSYHPRFGYDMAPSGAMHWYGTGRF